MHYPNGLPAEFAFSVHDRIKWPTPIATGVVHHDVDEDWKQAAHYGGAISNLIAVNAAVPGCSAVDQLITQDIEPVEDDRENP